jgi:UDP-N-acetyl-D-glucosamine dehydrogenase
MAPKKLVVIGQGYVGLPLAMRGVEVGYQVVAVDVDPRRVATLRAGGSFVEDVPAPAVAAALASGRYTVTDDYRAAAGFDFAVVTVPTPLTDGLPDLTHVTDAMRSLAPLVRRGATVVLESTTYPGTTDTVVVPLLEQGSGLRAGADFHVGYSPERIDPGNPVWGLVNTPKVVAGVDEASLGAVLELYGRLVEKTVPVRGTREAELTKLLENTFRHVNIALVNELAVLARQLGVDVSEVVDAAATKPFGFMRFVPGPGVGGHCLPVDPSYLSWEVRRRLDRPFRFVELANEINSHMPAYVVQRVAQVLNQHRKSLNGARVLLLGLAYKKNSGDARESPALKVARLLHEQGAVLSAVDELIDPLLVPGYVTLCALTPGRVAAADLVVVLTDHDGFDYACLDGAVAVLDTRYRAWTRPVDAL